MGNTISRSNNIISRTQTHNKKSNQLNKADHFKRETGNAVSRNNNIISRVHVSKSPNEDDQSVVYSTPDSRTCTLRAVVGVETSIVTLRDYTFDHEGTVVNITVRNQGDGVHAMVPTYGGNALEVRTEGGQFIIVYGVAGVRCSTLVAVRQDTDTHGNALFVTHLFGIAEQRVSLLVFEVWYDIAKGRYMFTLTGPSRFSSDLEAKKFVMKAYHIVPSSDADDSTVVDGSNQTSITGLINNSGPVYGHFNGSIFNFY